jgi:hypothetical protein
LLAFYFCNRQKSSFLGMRPGSAAATFAGHKTIYPFNRPEMKQILFTLSLLFAVLLLSSCEGNDVNPSDGPQNDTLGVTWTEVPSPTVFSARNSYGLTEYQNKLWVTGGFIAPGETDQEVWSTSDGENWERVTDSPTFSPRADHVCLTFNNKMWMIGGMDFQAGSPDFKDDVLSSTDGITWTLESNFTWTPNVNGPNGMVYDNQIFLFGADGNSVSNRIYASSTGTSWDLITNSAPYGFGDGPNPTLFQNKMWTFQGNSAWHSTDGITWTEETITVTNGTMSGESFEVIDNQLWIIGADRVANSSDGINWTVVKQFAPWNEADFLESVVFDDKLWVIGRSGSGSTATQRIWYSGIK